MRVVGQSDQTIIGWISPRGFISIASYNNQTGGVQIAHIGQLFHDDHGSPSILVEPDKRLTVFFSGHNGGAMFYKTTLFPEDISVWGPLEQIPGDVRGLNGFTYPNPVALPAEQNRTWLFWRGGDYSADYAVRSASGRWTRARRLIAAPGQRPYLKVASNARNLIGLAFTDGHPRERTTSVYYAAYRYGSLWTAAGRRIQPLARGPITSRQASVVYDGERTGISSWVWDVAVDSRDRPVIVYATFPSPRNHLYWYTRWTGRTWEHHLLTPGGPTISPTSIEFEYSGGMALDHSNPSIVYLSRRVGRWFQIEKWTTRDGGSRWRRQAITATPGASNVRPVVPRGASGGPMGVLWLHGSYGDYTDYGTSIAHAG